MRLPGWCKECRKFRYVRVSSHALVMMAHVQGVAEGICHECELAEDKRRRELRP